MLKVKWEKVEAYQKLYDLTDEELARDVIGMDKTTFSKYKSGERRLSPIFIEKLAKAMNFKSLDELYYLA